MKGEIHQAVHGYSRGHTQLASSTKIDPSDSDLLARLSDLSGALLQDREFTSYLTFYPLPSRTLYVIAQTWLDDESPRAGCVLTHSLLVPMNLWLASETPSDFATLFRRPSRETLDAFNKPLSYVPTVERLAPIPAGDVEEFATRYFGEGLQPLVWFGQDSPELVSWRILQGLWPSLRRRFSCCTYALKPRALDERPFDVLFAPQGARSRFAEYPTEHVISSKPSVTERHEDWVAIWTKCICENAMSVDEYILQNRIKTLSQGIEPYPTAIRRVFLYLELTARSQAAPMAAIGALDVLATLNLPLHLMTQNAADLVKATVNAGARLGGVEGLELLYLLAERITTQTDTAAQDGIRGAVRDLVLKEEDLLTSTEGFLRRRSGTPLAFVGGVADAIPRSLKAGSQNVAHVLSLSVMGQLFAEQFPEVLDAILRASRAIHVSQATEVLANWCSQVHDLQAREALRKRLLPMILPHEKLIARELLRDVAAAETVPLCETIEGSPNSMNAEIARMFAEAFAGPNNPDIGAWALQTNSNTYFSAYILALTLPLTKSSLDYLLSRKEDRKGPVATAVFIERALRNGVDWAEHLLTSDENLWSMILGNPFDEHIVAPLYYLTERIHRTAISRVPDAPTRLSRLPPPIQDHAIMQWAIDWIESGRTGSAPAAWVDENWVVWRLQQDPTLVTRQLTAQAELSSEAWVRAWQLIESVPASHQWLTIVADVVEQLVRRRPRTWEHQASAAWCRVLGRLSDQPRLYLEMSTRALQFCFENRQTNLAPLVAAVFFPVHSAALQEHSPSLWNAFGFFEWDRGLELRRRLVDGFCQGAWPPEYFVLAAREPWLLRKLCRRMLRQWGGSQLLQRAHGALISHDDFRQVELIGTLRDVLQNPTFYEEWD